MLRANRSRGWVQRSQPRCYVFVLTLLIASSTIVLSAQPSTAYIPDCTRDAPRSNYFDGMYKPRDDRYIGVSARIKVRYAAVCDTVVDSRNFVNAHSLLGNSSGIVGTRGWIQSGYWRYHSGSLVHFSQIFREASNPDYYRLVFGAQVNAGAIYRYWQQYYPDSQGFYHSNVDITRLQSYPSGLTSGWQGFTQQFVGEVSYRSNDMPGGVSFPASFTDLQVQTISGNWQSIPCPFLQGQVSDARWALNPTSCTSFDIWTQSYS